MRLGSPSPPGSWACRPRLHSPAALRPLHRCFPDSAGRSGPLPPSPHAISQAAPDTLPGRAAAAIIARSFSGHPGVPSGGRLAVARPSLPARQRRWSKAWAGRPRRTASAPPQARQRRRSKAKAGRPRGTASAPPEARQRRWAVTSTDGQRHSNPPVHRTGATLDERYTGRARHLTGATPDGRDTGRARHRAGATPRPSLTSTSGFPGPSPRSGPVRRCRR